MSEQLRVYGKEYYEYTELLSLGNVYYIMISKRLLLKPMIPMWTYFLCLFLVRNHIFFAMVGLPSFVAFSVFLVMYFPLWKACNFSAKAYIVFHCVFLLFLKMFSVPVSMFLEVLWTLCF